MHRRFILICAGLALLPVAWLNHKHAVRMADRAIGRPLTKDDQLPQGRADRYFGEDPLEVSERPENKAKQEQAILQDKFTLLIGGVAVFLILIGLKPQIRNPRPPENRHD